MCDREKFWSKSNAAKKGFKTFVITDAVRGVNTLPGDDQKAVKKMSSKGCIMIVSNDI